MVQSPRLKRHIHPLVPVITILFLLCGFLFIYSKPLQEKLLNNYGNYKNQRNVLIDKYNQDKQELQTYLTQPYSKLTDYRLNLTKSLAKSISSKDLLIEIKELDNQALKKFQTIEADINEDNDRISKTELLIDRIKSKIDAIDVYNNIVEFDNCLRKANNNNELDQCKVVYSKIKSPAELKQEYKKMVSKIFDEFFLYSKNEKTSMINKLVPYHNKMINLLESIINSPITL